MLALLALILSPTTQAAETTCTTWPAPVSADVCVTREPGSRNRDLVYFLHGLTDNEHAWEREFAPMYDAWAAAGKEAPVVVAISFGPAWFVNSPAWFPRASAQHIVEQVFPAIESAIGFTAEPGRRLLVGRSMGGHNAAFLAEKHPELFERVALLSPALNRLAPQDSYRDWRAFRQRNTGTQPWRVRETRLAMLAMFPTRKLWRQASPLLEPASSLTPGNAPAFYLACGDLDEYGFCEGTQDFGDLLASRGLKPEFKLLPGATHWAVDFAGLAAFLAP